MTIRAAPDAIAMSSLLLLGGALAAASWLTWPDLLIDFGREAYVAWRLGDGDTLYRDIAYLNGPLSPYWNALFMATTGLGIGALFLSNALVLVVLVGLIQWQLTELADRASAWAASAFLLLVFAFARYADIGNYAYLAPYSHETTHGLLLSFAALGSVAMSQRNRVGGDGAARFWPAASGLLLGAVALTKIEFLVALLPAVVLGLALTPSDGPKAARRLAVRPALLALGSATGVVLAAGLWLALATPLTAPQALAGISGGLIQLFDPRLAGLPFYRWGAGLDDVSENSLQLLNTVGLELGLLAPGLAAAHWLSTRRARVAVWIAAGLAAGLLLVIREGVDWLAAARPLPLYLLGLAIWRGSPLLRRSSSASEQARALAELPLIVFAGLLLAKLGLNARVYHYGFALAMPATLVVVVALLAWIPGELERQGKAGHAFRAWAAALLAACAIAHLDLGTRLLPELRSTLGEGNDRIHGDAERTEVLSAALAELERDVAPGGRLLVLPEGVMLNYLSRRSSPTRFISFTPFDLIVWGEENMLEALRASPPEAVLLVHRDSSEYGAAFLGRDYAKEIAGWLRAGYRRSKRFGAAPLGPGEHFGAELWLARPEVAKGDID